MPETATELTEDVVMARAIVLLLEAGCLTHSAKSIARAAAAVGIPVKTVTEQWRQRAYWTRARAYGQATVVICEGDEETVEPPRPAVGADHHPGGYRNNMRERDGIMERRCCRCEKWKPATPEHFYVKRPETGALASMCVVCRPIYQRTRYLSVKAHDALGEAGLRFEVVDGDPELTCKACGHPIAPGQEAEVEGISYHRVCSARGGDTPGWINRSRRGRWHSTESCAADPVPMTLDTARIAGLEPCGVCSASIRRAVVG